MNRRTLAQRCFALGAASALACVAVGVDALAAHADTGAGSSKGDVAVVNTETVQVKQDAGGAISSKRVYEQLSMTGHGKVDLLNPISTKGLRNLDGFGHVATKNGEEVVDTTVDGHRKLRSVSTYTKSLPITVSTSYTLDGKAVKPGDVVGKSGRLEAFFKVTNRTSRTQAVSFPDGKGGTTERQVAVPVPMVGSLTTTAPPSFTHVRSEAANLAGDGKGGTQLSFTMTLVPPIGSTTSSFGYTADITDGVVPKVEVVALPVDPLQSPTFKGAAASYQQGADKGADLVGGAVKVDDNLLKLRDGSAQLLAGLVKLRAGADQLDDGLADKAAPGAKKLAAGANDLSSGLGALKDGTGQVSSGAGQLSMGGKALAKGNGALASGSRQLATGTGSALDGSKQLTGGLKQINGGLGLLAGQLPGAGTGITQLQGGISQLLTGLGDESSPTSLIGGLAALKAGLTSARDGSTQVKGGLSQLATSTTAGLPAAKGGVDQIRSALSAAAGSIDPGDADTLADALNRVKGFCGAIADAGTQTSCNNAITTIVAGVNGDAATSSKSKLTALKAGLSSAAGGLEGVSGGIGSAITALNTQLIPGVGQIHDGLDQQALPGVVKLQGGATAVKAGLQQVDGGLDSLADGVTAAIQGVLALKAGSGVAYQGSADLTQGLGQLDAGATKLSAGAQQASTGAYRLAAGATKLAAGAKKVDVGEATAKAGSGQLATGAKALSAGILDAAGGAGLLADGLTKASSGASKLPTGATALSNQGTKKLVAAGEDTADQFGELVAVVAAGSKRATSDGMAYGAPTGADGYTAYSFDIAGVDGEGSKNVGRTLGGLALLGVGGGVIGLRRRFL